MLMKIGTLLQVENVLSLRFPKRDPVSLKNIVKMSASFQESHKILFKILYYQGLLFGISLIKFVPETKRFEKSRIMCSYSRMITSILFLMFAAILYINGKILYAGFQDIRTVVVVIIFWNMFALALFIYLLGNKTVASIVDALNDLCEGCNKVYVDMILFPPYLMFYCLVIIPLLAVIGILASVFLFKLGNFIESALIFFTHSTRLIAIFVCLLLNILSEFITKSINESLNVLPFQLIRMYLRVCRTLSSYVMVCIFSHCINIVISTFANYVCLAELPIDSLMFWLINLMTEMYHVWIIVRSCKSVNTAVSFSIVSLIVSNY